MERSGAARRVVQILGWLSLLLMAAGAVLLAAGQALPGPIALGIGLIGLGLNVLLAGDLVVGGGPRPFTVRGPVVRGVLEAAAGFSDLSVGACPPDRIASLAYGPLGKPDFKVSEGVARVRLIQSLLRPNVAPWRADLAANVLWDVDARSFLGRLSLDLSALRLEKVTVGTTLGRISVTCPQRGYTQIIVRAWMGDIDLAVPAEAGAKVLIRRGRLGSVTNHNPRLSAFRPDRFSTPDYDSSLSQVEIHIETFAGDVTLS